MSHQHHVRPSVRSGVKSVVQKSDAKFHWKHLNPMSRLNSSADHIPNASATLSWSSTQVDATFPPGTGRGVESLSGVCELEQPLWTAISLATATRLSGDTPDVMVT